MMAITDICIMHLVLTAATSAEIQPAIDWLAKQQESGTFKKTDILITGIGGVATTYFLGNFLSRTKPGVVIQAGIAGSFQDDREGDTVAIRQDCFADMGVWENEQFRDIFDLGLSEKNQPPFANGLLLNPYEKLLSMAGLEQVSSITVNEITTDSRRIDWYKQNLSPVVESMEGAAFHYVCLLEKIPFLQMRSISNLVGERDKTKWHMAKAINNLNKTIISLLNKLCQYDETYSWI
jgi:futalosine hydrolase